MGAACSAKPKKQSGKSKLPNVPSCLSPRSPQKMSPKSPKTQKFLENGTWNAAGSPSNNKGFDFSLPVVEEKTINKDRLEPIPIQYNKFSDISITAQKGFSFSRREDDESVTLLNDATRTNGDQSASQGGESTEISEFDHEAAHREAMKTVLNFHNNVTLKHNDMIAAAAAVDLGTSDIEESLNQPFVESEASLDDINVEEIYLENNTATEDRLEQAHQTAMAKVLAFHRNVTLKNDEIIQASEKETALEQEVDSQVVVEEKEPIQQEITEESKVDYHEEDKEESKTVHQEHWPQFSTEPTMGPSADDSLMDLTYATEEPQGDQQGDLNTLETNTPENDPQGNEEQMTYQSSDNTYNSTPTQVSTRATTNPIVDAEVREDGVYEYGFQLPEDVGTSVQDTEEIVPVSTWVPGDLVRASEDGEYPPSEDEDLVDDELVQQNDEEQVSAYDSDHLNERKISAQTSGRLSVQAESDDEKEPLISEEVPLCDEGSVMEPMDDPASPEDLVSTEDCVPLSELKASDEEEVPVEDPEPLLESHSEQDSVKEVPAEDPGKLLESHSEQDSEIEVPAEDPEPLLESHPEQDSEKEVPAEDPEPLLESHSEQDSEKEVPAEDPEPLLESPSEQDSEKEVPAEDPESLSESHSDQDSEKEVPVEDSEPLLVSHSEQEAPAEDPEPLIESRSEQYPEQKVPAEDPELLLVSRSEQDSEQEELVTLLSGFHLASADESQTLTDVTPVATHSPSKQEVSNDEDDDDEMTYESYHSSDESESSSEPNHSSDSDYEPEEETCVRPEDSNLKPKDEVEDEKCKEEEVVCPEDSPIKPKEESGGDVECNEEVAPAPGYESFPPAEEKEPTPSPDEEPDADFAWQLGEDKNVRGLLASAVMIDYHEDADCGWQIGEKPNLQEKLASFSISDCHQDADCDFGWQIGVKPNLKGMFASSLSDYYGDCGEKPHLKRKLASSLSDDHHDVRFGWQVDRARNVKGMFASALMANYNEDVDNAWPLEEDKTL